MTEEKTEVMTVAEVAERLRTTIRTVRNLIRNGKLRGVRVGKGYRITQEALEMFLHERELRQEQQ